MEKIKIAFENIPEIHIVEIIGINGDRIQVAENIPYFKKEYMALELGAFLTVADEEQQIMYDNYKYLLLESVLIAKYYTNIDVSELGNEEDWQMLFDYLTINGVYDKIREVINRDYTIVQDIAEKMLKPTRELFNRKNSLAYKVSIAFSSILDGNEDLAEAVARSEAVNNTMVDMIDAYNEQRREKKNKNIKLDNGAVISLAKKKK